MDKINQKLNKYRNKLINATSSDKMDYYNLKMQQYLIMQKNLLKSGGSTNGIFALAEDAKSHISAGNEVYSIKEVEDNLKNISEKIEKISESYNETNKQMTEKLIDIRREAHKSIQSKTFSESPTFNNINEAIDTFKTIENVLIQYYVDEITNLKEEDAQKIEFILSELALFEKSTIKAISEQICDKSVPKNIKDYLCKNTEAEVTGTSVEVVNGESLPVTEGTIETEKLKLEGGKRVRQIYRKYF